MNDRLRPLSGLDAMFLYLETPKNPMHVGSVSIFDDRLTFEGLRRHVAERLHLVRAFHERLVTVPLGLDKPHWIDDPDFNLDWHLYDTALPRPGDWRQLRRLASRVFGRPLDRSRPLWEMVFVEGLDAIPQVPPGSVGLITKIHHAAIDGMSGADLLGVLFDPTAEPRPVPPPPPRSPGPVPGRREMLGVAARAILSRPRLVPQIAREVARAALRARRQDRAAPSPTVPFGAPSTPINGSISSTRIWNTTLLSLDRVKTLKRASKGTVNDVVLAICAGGLRKWLEAHRALPDEPLIAMVPVSTRTAAEKNTLGNQITAMFVPLATDVADPVERLNRISAHTTSTKEFQGALDAKTLMQASELVPFGLAAQASRLYSRAGIADRHRPPYNCVITNVPGPQIPLYLGGSRLRAQMGMAPILEGMGLIITVTTYDGVMSVSPFSSPAVMPDLDAFCKMLRESANELEAALLPAGGADLSEAFARLGAKLAQPGIELPRELFQLDLTGPEAQRWICDFRSVPPTVARGEAPSPGCTLRMESRALRAILAGTLDGSGAVERGLLEVRGDPAAADAFGKVLARLA